MDQRYNGGPFLTTIYQVVRDTPLGSYTMGTYDNNAAAMEHCFNWNMSVNSRSDEAEVICIKVASTYHKEKDKTV